MNVAPLPSWLSRVTVPSNASVMRLTTAKPKPCPFDFVVKSGVKSLGLTSSGMPTPVSLTVMTMLSVSRWAFIESLPPFGIA